MTNGNVHDAWNTYWERQDRSAAGVQAMPDDWLALNRRRADHWQEYARTLPRNARVLDLASGDGAVMAHLLGVRRDLKMQGVDRATTLPKPPRGAKLRGGVSMENLPLPDGHFAVVTSQFGFEYGEMGKAAAEVSRVLQAKGSFALMTHRLDGPIVAHNRARRTQLTWALEEQQLLRQARNSLGLRTAGIAALPRPIIEAPELAARQFGEGSAAWQIAAAVRETLHLGRQDRPANVSRVLDDIESKAENELGRINSLEQAAMAVADREALVALLADAGLVLTSETELVAPLSDAPFADFRIFRLQD